MQDDFLAPAGIRALLECAGLRRDQGKFSAARIGADSQLQRLEEVRGDSTCWLDAPLFEAERLLVMELENLRLDLNRSALLGLFDHELHYAWYPPGAGYVRHVDRPRGRNGRRVSFILYLNESWHPGDGGELRVFEGAHAYRDIEPIGGRLVCFLTEGREHAVLPTHVDRLSLTGWFRGRDAV